MSTDAQKKSAPKTKSHDAVKLLTDDHAEVHKLVLKYNKLAKAQAPADERAPLAQQICSMLQAHTQIEEEIFYPAARAADVASDLLDEAAVEHASVKELIAQLVEMDADDDLFDAKIKVVGEYVDHHVKEEEEKLFPACKKAKMDLEALGQELQERKDELTEG